MRAFLFIGFRVILLIGLPAALGLLFYFVPKKLGHPKTGKYLTIAFGIFAMVIIAMVVFEDQLFTKNDARKLLEEQDVILKDGFMLEKYKSASIFNDYYHTFTLMISEKDRIIASEQIKLSENFKKLGEPITDFRFDRINTYNGPKETQNYETNTSYVREYFKPNKKNAAPTFRRISIGKKGNQLIFEDF